MSFTNLISTADLTDHDIECILDRAAEWHIFSKQRLVQSDVLRGVTQIQFFCEPSTRTQLSFELAGKRLGAVVSTLDGSTSSLLKGESLEDTLETIGAMSPDVLVMRHASEEALLLAKDYAGCSVICAGGGTSSHPSQALLDAFTIYKFKDHIEGLNIVIFGDIKHSRVAASNIDVLTRLGAHVTLVGPKELLLETVPAGCEQTTDFAAALTDADVVMCLRPQHERWDRENNVNFGARLRPYRLNETLFNKAKPDAVIMHPGPVTGENELTRELARHERSLIVDQVRLGVPTRMAILDLITEYLRG